MGKKTFSAFLTLFLSFFFLMGTLNAMSPQITEEFDPETQGLRLFVRGKIEVPSKHETSPPLSLTFRTCALEDFQKPNGSLGIVSQLRADPIQMQHFIGGPRGPAITLETGYHGIWKKRQIERNESGYTPATLFTLFTCNSQTPETQEGIGYFALGRNTDEQLIFFGGLLPEFQDRGIMTVVLEHVLTQLLPAFRESPLTSQNSKKEHRELLVTMDNNNPLSDKIGASVQNFSKTHKIPVSHQIEEKERKDTGGAPIIRQEHQFRVNLKELYAQRDTAAAASTAASDGAKKPASAASDGASADDALREAPKQ